jgi:hypothetical protein
MSKRKAFLNHRNWCMLFAMTQIPPNTRKPSRGRPHVPPEEYLVQRSIRLTAGQWAKVDAHGGIAWLREMIDRAPAPEAPPAELESPAS